MTFRGGKVPPEPFDWETFFQDLQRSGQRRMDLVQANHEYAWILHQQPVWTKPTAAFHRVDFDGPDMLITTCCTSRPNGGYCPACGRGPGDGPITANRALASNA